jgi:hypothetical protein
MQELLQAQVDELKQELDDVMADAQEARQQLAGCSDELSSCRDQVGATGLLLSDVVGCGVNGSRAGVLRCCAGMTWTSAGRRAAPGPVVPIRHLLWC